MFLSVSTLFSIVLEPFIFLLCVAKHFLPTWISNPVRKFTIRVLGRDPTIFHEYQPHLKAAFEGYYTRITTSSGATIVVIFSTVRNVPKEQKPHLLHFSYLPSSSTEQALVFNIYPDKLTMDGNPSVQGTELELMAFNEAGKPIGAQTIGSDGTADFWLSLPVEDGALDIDIQLTKRSPWGGVNSTSQSPEGLLAALESLLPLHWFVWSTGSEAEVNIDKVTRCSSGEEKVEHVLGERGHGHMEKNWGASFPTGWIWIESLNPSPPPVTLVASQLIENSSTSYVTLAGGSIMGLKAFFVGFESPVLFPTSTCRSINWTFRPLFTVLLPLIGLGIYVSPFCKEEYNALAGTYKLQVVDWTVRDGWRKLVLTCAGTPGLNSSCDGESTSNYLQLPCPMNVGHGNSFAKETFEANVLVEAYVWKKYSALMSLKNRGRWEKIVNQTFNRAALEWGGSYWGSKSSEIFRPNSAWLYEVLRGKGGRNIEDRDLKAH
ncbi:hypothetical protein BDZ91DRAFT_711379 [Kalaharituber pfeilii]|nr:hypothetical protein BDZ91DRAFT_711379 [Kalaharituber pfeilii]